MDRLDYLNYRNLKLKESSCRDCILLFFHLFVSN